MPTNKDFKRLVRGRMQKTGESYTAARSHLLRQRSNPSREASISRGASASRARVAAAAPFTAVTVEPLVTSATTDFARIAGMSDEAVKKATGCPWAKWVKALDHVEAYTWPHREIADYVHEKYKVPDWWTQMVTVGYERIKGLRAKGQRRGGGYEATRSKVFPVPLGRLYRAFHDSRTRARWLSGVALKVRTATREKSIRISWPDGTSVEAYFTGKGAAKSQVQVQHRKLVDQADAARRKAYWSERLAALGEILAPAVKKTA
mgnify:CR=1 FL=1